MAKGKRRPPKTYSMYPSKHDEVSEILQEHDLEFTFRNNDNDSGYTKTWSTSIMGRFICRNPKCGANGWSSNRISIVIRMYPRRQYNATVYHQRCKRCDNLSSPILDETYAERVTYWLKKWSGILVEQPNHSRGSKGPHQESLCEGCKAGHCRQGN
ncbi:hypothetical protein SAMD00023353_0403610 [Rosellinia necatrix]|uniref:3CxxC-type domain-containing protein n=1 Tax=Rosellinia necatrix TaxID=77044 RepID=A0A1W2TWB8_ROSNE|nr:hypothetical protein SAMD00023353_0403610 [Rosellinia necatrix]